MLVKKIVGASCSLTNNCLSPKVLFPHPPQTLTEKSRYKASSSREKRKKFLLGNPSITEEVIINYPLSIINYPLSIINY